LCCRAFSFADGTFITPWITLWDGGNRRIATYIEFVFVYSGNDIKEVRASVDCKYPFHLLL